MEELAFVCGNCKFHDEWTGECTEPNSSRSFTRDSDEACYEWEEKDV